MMVNNDKNSQIAKTYLCKFDEECELCSEKLTKDNYLDHSLIQFFCEHVFHRKCAVQWAQQKATCPTCSVEIIFANEEADWNQTQTAIQGFVKCHFEPASTEQEILSDLRDLKLEDTNEQKTPQFDIEKVRNQPLSQIMANFLSNTYSEEAKLEIMLYLCTMISDSQASLHKKASFMYSLHKFPIAKIPVEQFKPFIKPFIAFYGDINTLESNLFPCLTDEQKLEVTLELCTLTSNSQASLLKKASFMYSLHKFPIAKIPVEQFKPFIEEFLLFFMESAPSQYSGCYQHQGCDMVAAICFFMKDSSLNRVADYMSAFHDSVFPFLTDEQQVAVMLYLYTQVINKQYMRHYCAEIGVSLSKFPNHLIPKVELEKNPKLQELLQVIGPDFVQV